MAGALKAIQAIAGKALRPTRELIGTPNWNRWFGGSKVVDAEGKPLVVYHGTGRDFGGEFKSLNSAVTEFGEPATFFFTDSSRHASDYAKSRGKTDRWFVGLTYSKEDSLEIAGDESLRGKVFAQEGPFASKREAREFLEREGGNVILDRGGAQNVIPSYLSLKNPMVVDAEGKNWQQLGQVESLKNLGLGNFWAPEMVGQYAAKHGYDGAIIRSVDDSVGATVGVPHDVYIASTPTQIKSAISNTGEFSGKNPDIRGSATTPALGATSGLSALGAYLMRNKED